MLGINGAKLAYNIVIIVTVRETNIVKLLLFGSVSILLNIDMEHRSTLMLKVT